MVERERERVLKYGDLIDIGYSASAFVFSAYVSIKILFSGSERNGIGIIRKLEKFPLAIHIYC